MKILMVNLPYSGHTNPTLPLAKALVGRGHRVTYVNAESFRRRIGETGADGIPNKGKDGGAQLLIYEMFFYPGIEIARRRGIPCVRQWSQPAWSGETWRRAPALFKISAKLIDRQVLTDTDARSMGFARSDLRRGILDSRPELNLVYVPEAFQDCRGSFDDSYLFLVPPAAPSASDREIPWDRMNGPVVYISLGSIISNRGFCKECIRAFGGKPLSVILNTGKIRPETLGRIPGNIYACSFVPQIEVLRHTDVYARVLSWLYDRKRGDAEQDVTVQIIDDLEQSLVNGEWSMVNDDNQETMTWQELLILESEYQVRKVLNQMRQVVRQGLGDIPFSLKLLRLLIRRIMENITMPFHGEPVTDIQVMGVLETRLLDFDKLLLLNVEEGVVPQTQADSSFIPYYLRKAYSMQTSDERATVYAYNFFRLLSRAGHSTLLFTSTDAANSKGMSRFIMQMLVSDRFQVTKGQLKEQSAIEPIDEARLNTSGTSLLDTLHVTNGRVMGAEDKPYSLSPSALNTYLTCPRLFCFTYIQGVRQPDEDEKIFGAATIGTFVHNAMQYLYETHLGCSNDMKVTISPDDIDRILQDEKKVDEAMIHAYEKANKQWEVHHPGEQEHYKAAEHRSEQSTIRTYIQNILERDRADAALGLQIYLLEADRYVDVEVPEVGQIKMGGRIDRVDIVGGPGAQKMRIIDYKSGKFDTSKLSVREGVEVLMDKPEKGYIRQTFIYSHALMETEKEPMVIEPNLYFCSRPLPGARTTLSFNNKALTDYRDVDGVFMEKLTQKAQEVLTVREFPPCEEDKCPKYCPFFMTCGRKVKVDS